MNRARYLYLKMIILSLILATFSAYINILYVAILNKFRERYELSIVKHSLNPISLPLGFK